MLNPHALDVPTLYAVATAIALIAAIAMAGFFWRHRSVPGLAWFVGSDAVIALALAFSPPSGQSQGLARLMMALVLLVVLKDLGFLLYRLHTMISDRERDSRTDPLTARLNRRSLLEQGGIEFERARRQHVPLSAIMVDIDHFKAINDGYGHKVGDAVLVHLGGLLSNHLRKFDITARFGGEEFVVLLPGTPLSTAVLVAEKLRGALASEAWPEVDGRRITASFGVSAYAGHDSLQELIAGADRAVQLAKKEGRNRVESVAI